MPDATVPVGGALGARTLDHVSITVPDLERAVGLFVDLFGAQVQYRREFAPPPGSDEMRRQYGAHPAASFRLAKLAVGGAALEVFEYAAPDRREGAPRNSDVGGMHLAFGVSDIDAAVARLEDDDRIVALGTVQQLEAPHPLAGRRWIYLVTEWGLFVELVAG